MLLVAVIVSGLTLARHFAPDEDEETADDEKRRHGHPSISCATRRGGAFTG